MVTTESEVRYAARYAPLQFSTESAATTKQTRGLNSKKPYRIGYLPLNRICGSQKSAPYKVTSHARSSLQ